MPMTTDQPEKEIWTPKEVATRLDRHVNAIYKAIHAGSIRADRVGNRGEYLIHIDELRRVLPSIFGGDSTTRR